MSDEKSEFKPKNFWEAVYNQPLEKLELNQIQGNAKAFVKFLKEEQLLQKRRKLEVEIYKIDRELANLNKNTFPVMGRYETWKKFESFLPNMKIKK